MPRPKNPYRLVLQQNRIEPQVMQGRDKSDKPILLLHVQLSEGEPVPLLSFAFNFNSPEELLSFLQPLIDKAAEIWPDNEWMKEYLSE
jgi:hypothetical protein